jgi:hypothetical protein
MDGDTKLLYGDLWQADAEFAVTGTTAGIEVKICAGTYYPCLISRSQDVVKVVVGCDPTGHHRL